MIEAKNSIEKEQGKDIRIEDGLHISIMMTIPSKINTTEFTTIKESKKRLKSRESRHIKCLDNSVEGIHSHKIISISIRLGAMAPMEVPRVSMTLTT